MASGYAFPLDGSHYQGHTQFSSAGSNDNSNGSRLAVRTAASNGSLFTHAERSQENTPQASPNTEREHASTFDYNQFAVAVNSRHTHDAQHDHEHLLDHDHDHSHHSHHPHSHSHTPMKARPRGESDLGRPASSTYRPSLDSIPAASSSWFSLPEALTSLLIPLPYMLASAAYLKPGGFENDGIPPLSAYAKLQQSVLEEQKPQSHELVRIGNGFIEACTLTSGTLLLVGMIAKMRSSERMLDRRKDKTNVPRHSESVFTPATALRMLIRALSVGTPFYAATQIGGLRTGIVLLVAVASNVSNTDTALRPSLNDWFQTLRAKMISLCVVLLAAVLDFSGITFRASFSDILTGYLALAWSLTLLPSPLPSIAISGSQGPAETPTAGSRPSWSSVASSPLVSCRADGNVTLAAGVALAILTVVSSVLLDTSPSITPTAIAFSTLSIASAVAAIFFARPSSIRSRHKAGLGLGCSLLTICVFLFSPSVWPGSICNGAICAMSYFGVRFDASFSTAHREHDNHLHDHAHNAQTHSHPVEGNYSMFTRKLLDNCEPGSLAHGILGEKDSRRIAYFTWYVPAAKFWCCRVANAR